MCAADNETSPPIYHWLAIPTTQTLKLVTPTLVQAAIIEKLKLGGASGLDRLPARLFKKLPESL